MDKRPHVGAQIVMFSTLVAIIQTSFAEDQFKVDVGASLVAHSNAALQDANKRSDMERIGRADVSYLRSDDGFLKTNIDYAAARRDFLHNAQQDQTSIDGHADLLMHVIPRRLDAVLSHQISQSQTNSLTVNTTNNQERRSIVTAGLDGYAHLSPVDALVLSPRLTDVNFQKSSQSDSRRSLLTLGWQHELSRVSTTALNLTYGKVDFDNSSNDYKSKGIEALYKSRLSRLSYQIGGGFNRVDRDHGRSVDGSSARFAADYAGDGYSAGGSLVRELTDTSIGLSGLESSVSNFSAKDSNFDLPDILLSTRLDVYFRRQFEAATQLSMLVGARRDNYDVTPRDQRSYYVQLGYQYSINRYWAAGANVRFEDVRLLNDINHLHYRETTPEVFVTYRWSQRLDMRMALARQQRHANVAQNVYTDNLATVSANYRFY